MSLSAVRPPPRVADAFVTVWRFVFGSVFRFLILLGLLFLGLGAFWADGIEAGHLLIYGLTSITIGVIGWVIVWWKIQDEY